MHNAFFLLFAVICGVFPLSVARAACPVGDRPVVVGVPVSAPFVIQNGDRLTGFDVELWRFIANGMGCKTTFKPISYADRIPSLTEGRLDAVMGGMTITAERLAFVDFSMSYYNSGQAIIQREAPGFHVVAFAKAFWQSALKKILLGLFILVTFWGNVIWAAERFCGRRNHLDENASNDIQFSPKYWLGVFEASYFVQVTMTTVGFGDFTPKTVWGRALTLVMMWTGVSYGGFFIGAAIAFSTGYSEAMGTIDPSSLRGKTVAVVQGTTGETAAMGLGAELIQVATLTDAILSLKNRTVDAVIFDEPDLRYHATNGEAIGMAVSASFTEEPYGIGLQIDSPLRRAVNLGILAVREDGRYDKLHSRYFGSN